MTEAWFAGDALTLTEPPYAEKGLAHMDSMLSKDLELFAQIAEAKRIYWGIESALNWASPACVVITSAVPREGKTTVAANLSTVAAQQGDKRILLVDLNWYEPRQHRVFGLGQNLDVGSFSRRKSIKELVSQSGIERLDILTAAQSTQNSDEIGADLSRIGAEIIEEAREVYDFTVIDTCSILRMNRFMMDPVNLAKAADGASLVVLTNETPKPSVRRAHMLLETAGVNVLGVIANQWKNPLV